MKKFAAIIMAAGQSQRLGQPKQLVRFRDTTLVGQAIRSAQCAGCEPVLVVLGAFEKEVAAAIEDEQCLIVKNENWKSGLGSSIAAGVKNLQDIGANIDGVLLTLCDQPLVEVAHLEKLCEAVASDACVIAATQYSDGQLGAPAVFERSMFPELMKLDNEQGAKSVIAHCDQVVGIAPTGELIDVDTPDDLNQLNHYQQP